LYILFKQSKQESVSDETEEQMPLGKMLLFLAGGLALIVLGGTWTVNGAQDLAAALGLSSTFIGLTIVALGTSLPELVTSVVAANKGESALSIGNVLGSNILNILFILGISALLHPIPVQLENILDCLILGGVALIVYLMFCTSDKMSRKRGIAFLLLYVLYLIFITVR
jgi:cation:H+ antiporter